jgi:ectoine hydroxylase-related dioxygenase (phytanoyl-CoA dioxygenase family)
MGQSQNVAISDDVINEFHENGVTVIRGLFGPWVDGVREAIEENKLNPSWRERTYKPENKNESEFFQDYCVWNNFAGYRALVVESPMAQIAAKLMRSKTAKIFHDHVLVKEPGNSVKTPWHHDQPYYIVDGRQSVSFWVPLDMVPQERSIEFVAGSHQWGKDFKPKRFDGTDLYAEDGAEPVPEIDNCRDSFNIKSWATEPGDAIAFNFRTLHGAAANPSPDRRRVTSVRWVGDDARFVQRQGKTSPFFPDLDYRDGDPFGGKDFPLIFPKVSH